MQQPNESVIYDWVNQSRCRMELQASGTPLTREQQYQIRLGERAENHLYQQYERFLYQQIQLLADCIDGAYSAALEGFGAAISTFDGSSPFLSWLKQKVQSALLDHKRKVLREESNLKTVYDNCVDQLQDDHNTFVINTVTEADDTLEDALPGLTGLFASFSPIQQRIIRLFSHGYRWTEIGPLLGLSAGATRSRFNRLRDFIRDRFHLNSDPSELTESLPPKPKEKPMISTTQSLPLVSRIAKSVRSSTPRQWGSLTFAGSLIALKAVFMGTYVFPLYGTALAGTLLLDRYRRNINRQARLFFRLTLYSVLTFLSISNAPAHAIFFNRIDDILTGGLQVFGLTGLEQVADWVTYLLLIIGTIIVAGIVIKGMRNRAGDDEEDASFVGKIIKFLFRLILGDLVLSFFTV